MLRICLIITIVAGLGAAAVSFKYVQDIIVTTRQARDDWHNKDTAEIAAHTKTKATLKTTQATLDTTQKNLDQAKNDLEAANGKVALEQKNNADLTANLEKAKSERDDAEQKLSRWNGLPDPAKIQGIIADLEKTQKANQALGSENKLLATQVTEWKDRWENIFHSDVPVILPTGLRGKILAVDPKFDFVVLNIGAEQGAKTRGLMMVDRDGKLLGKVQIESVLKDRCVANILPGWTRGQIMEGDEVLY